MSAAPLAGSYSHSAICTSLGMSMSTGPGRPLLAMKKASRTVCASLVTSVTSQLCLVMDIVMPRMSAS